MSSFNESSCKFGSNGRSPAERRKLLEELRTQLPPTGPVLERGGSPLERKTVLLVEFLRCMLNGEPASFDKLANHPAYVGRRFNFAGQWCKEFGLQWRKVGGKTIYPPIAANIWNLICELNELASHQLEAIASGMGKSVDELIDNVLEKLQGEFIEEPDEFVDLPEDFHLRASSDFENASSQIEEMLQHFKSACSEPSDSGNGVQGHQEFIALPSNESGFEIKPELGEFQIEAFLKEFEPQSESSFDSIELSHSDGSHVESSEDPSSLPDLNSGQSPE